MNPLLIARNLRDEYLRLLKTTFRPRQQELRDRFNTEIERDGFLTNAARFKGFNAIRGVDARIEARGEDYAASPTPAGLHTWNAPNLS